MGEFDRSLKGNEQDKWPDKGVDIGVGEQGVGSLSHWRFSSESPKLIGFGSQVRKWTPG